MLLDDNGARNRDIVYSTLEGTKFRALRDRHKQLQPVRVADDATGQKHEDDHQDWPAATPDQSPAPKAEHPLQPVEQSVEQEQLQQPHQATRSITIHVKAPLLQGD